MTILLRPLMAAGAHGRWLLVAGLVAGVSLPSVADLLRGELPKLVALLLFLAALRIGPRRALGATNDIGRSLLFVIIFQLGCPIIYAGLLVFAGWSGPLAMVFALLLAAAPISGSPNITFLTGHDGAPALRVLIAGTVLMPLTVIPTFWLLPELAVQGIGAAVLRLLLLIFIAGALAFLIRGFLLRAPSDDTLQAMDGASAVVLAVTVVGLMSAVGPALTGDPMRLAGHLLLAFAVNFGFQIATFTVLRRTGAAAQSVGYAVAAGNRNIALFLAALPAAVTDPMLLFIGCYQVPMYLTPVLLRSFYRP